jgi:hypothetical protein
MDATLLLTRTLNYLQRQYVPSYLGLRVFAESTAKSIRNGWTIGYIDRRCATHRKQAYWKFSGVKGQDQSGNLEYRHFVVASPTSALAECRLISILAQQPEFARDPAVYSYLWPHPKGGHLFAHFMRGYRQREKAVAEAIEMFPGRSCVVLDLRSFYPSVDKTRVKNRFRERMKHTDVSGAQRENANYLVDQLLSVPGEKGLPIGPPLSHVLANVALENVDREMIKLYPSCYFRYVDDVVIVVEAAAVETALHQFRALVAADGLSVNESKTDVVSASQWKGQVHSREKASVSDSFSSLMRRLQIYLAHKPKRYDETRQLFRDAGFSLPFSRLRSAVVYGRFLRFLNFVLRRSRDWDQRFTYLFESPRTLLNHAIEVRDQLLESATKIGAFGVPKNGMMRRWFVQDIRFAFSRLLYLLPFSKYGELAEKLPPIPECGELRVTLEALRTGDATGLLRRPGVSVSTFAQLWKENATEVPTISWSQKPEYVERDSAVALATYGVVSIPADWISKNESTSNRQLLQIANGDAVEPFTSETPDYLKEIFFLKKDWTANELEILLRERFNNDEDVALFGLELGGGMYFS